MLTVIYDPSLGSIYWSIIIYRYLTNVSNQSQMAQDTMPINTYDKSGNINQRVFIIFPNVILVNVETSSIPTESLNYW